MKRILPALICFLLIISTVKAQKIVCVTPNGNGSQDGTSWNDAIPGTSLQDFINTADANYNPNNAATKTQFWIAQGIYKPTINPVAGSTDERDQTFLLKNGVALYGGFAGTETALNKRNIAANPTILSGDIDNDIPQNNSGNGYHVLVSVNNDNTAILDGFIVEEGNANVYGATVIISGASIEQYGGGGMYIAGSSPTTMNIIFRSNYADFSGGAIFNASSSPTLINTIFRNNSSGFYGGAMANYSSSPAIANSLFTGNFAQGDGGAIYNASSSPVITNSTFTGNTAFGPGCAIYNNNNSNSTINNSILYGNNGAGNEIYNDGFTGINTAVVTNSLVGKGSYAGTNGNINANPEFADAATNNYKLLAGSPAIDAGNNTKIPAGITTDLAGDLRIQNGTVDMGAYEGAYIPLPLKLISFEGKLNGNQAQLSWGTDSEENTSHFDIQYGADENFTTIGTIKAAGNSGTIQNYTFTHQTPHSGNNYYRLKMLDKDGTSVYSNVINVKLNFKQHELKVYPNPARGEVWVQHPTSSYITELKLINVMGKVLKTISVAKDVLQTYINLNELAPGIYNLIWSDGITAQSQMLVVE